MSTQHMIHYVMEPGLAGDGFTVGDASAVRADLDRLKSQVYDVRDLVSDTTGATVMTTQLQAAVTALPTGAVLYLPADAVVNLNDTITATSRVHIRGDGELQWTAGIATKPGLILNGAGSSVEGVWLTNPNMLGSATGDSSPAIRVRANDVTITGCHIDKWETGIQQFSDGEYYGLVVHGNFITDCVGVGSESKGDGIMVVGAGVVITDNLVTARTGTDARCGIVIEGLQPHQVTTITSNATDIANTAFVVSGNIVRGPFRRPVHAEDVYHYTISDNVLTGARWWGIMVWGGNFGTVVNNHVLWTDNGTTGGTTTFRVGIFVQLGKSVRISGNTVRMAAGSVWSHAIHLIDADVATGTPAYDVSGNTIINESAGAGNAVNIENINGGLVKVRDNQISGPFGRGVSVYAASTDSDFITSGNVFVGVTAPIYISAPRRSIVHDNYIDGVTGAAAIYHENGTLAVVKHNTIMNVTGIGISSYATATYAPGNTFTSVTTKTSGTTSDTLYGPA